jgi:hypothetical protein
LLDVTVAIAKASDAVFFRNGTGSLGGAIIVGVHEFMDACAHDAPPSETQLRKGDQDHHDVCRPWAHHLNPPECSVNYQPILINVRSSGAGQG